MKPRQLAPPVIQRLTPDRLEALRRFGMLECRATRLCRAAATYSTHLQYFYRGELRGDFSWRVTNCCEEHARRFAERHGVQMPAAECEADGAYST